MKNALNWFEIPSINHDRAVQFYSSILDAPLHLEVIEGVPNAILPYDGGDQGAVGGAVIFDARVKPTADGSVPYLNCQGQLDEVLARVLSAGGQIIMPRKDSVFGSSAWILDTEGNRIGLHSA